MNKRPRREKSHGTCPTSKCVRYAQPFTIILTDGMACAVYGLARKFALLTQVGVEIIVRACAMPVNVIIILIVLFILMLFLSF